jgi:predicted ATP-grasp superfamily ATP-dependent carboligase
MPDTLVILGASARAAAFSALRAGLTPVCGDLFADLDLRRRCRVTATTRYPAGLADIARQAPAGPWMYTGGLENHPELVDQIASTRTLHGNPGAALVAVRDPFRLEKVLRQNGLAFPECRASADGLPGDGTWLRKRRRSAGGLHVEPWHGGEGAKANERGWYFQHRKAGVACAAAYAGADGRSTFLGITEQLLGDAATEKSPFVYSGSVGPMPIDESIRRSFEAIGEVLAKNFGLVGLFGVDAVIDGEVVWTIEVNPRYTASMEIIERAFGLSVVGLHVAACRDGLLPDLAQTRANGWFGKRIAYAPRQFVANQQFVKRLDARNESTDWPTVADIPATGTSIEAGQPLTTVFAEAETRAAVLDLLERDLEAVLALIDD